MTETRKTESDPYTCSDCGESWPSIDSYRYHAWWTCPGRATFCGCDDEHCILCGDDDD